MTGTEEQVDKIGGVLNDRGRPLKERFRALFTLRGLGSLKSIELMAAAFKDPSALLKHEVAYCLGQMGDKDAVRVLVEVLNDLEQEPIVRHEAAEALGAIGDESILPLLIKTRDQDKSEVVVDTCKLAVERIEWVKTKKAEEELKLSANPYNSTDPAPPALETDHDSLKSVLLNDDLPLFQRYRAMFSLRNKGDDASILALAEGLKCKNALFRHEIAYVLGQVQSDIVTDQLINCLRDDQEMDMVRHECAEALGSIATDKVYAELKKYLDKSVPSVIRESCVVALDFADYNTSQEFQYADTLGKVASN